MTRTISFLISLILLTTCFSYAKSETNFDPSQYTQEELLKILDSIYKYIPPTPKGQILCDEQGIYVEFRGVYRDSPHSYYYPIELYVENNYGEQIHLSLKDVKVNRALIPLSNNFAYIPDNSIYVSSADSQFEIFSRSLMPYEITRIQQLTFTLLIQENNTVGDEIIKVPVSLILDVPLVFPDI